MPHCSPRGILEQCQSELSLWVSVFTFPSLTLSDCFPEKMLHKCSSSLSIEKISHESDFLGTNVTCAVLLIWSEISLQIQIERFGTKEKMLQYRLYLEPVANDAQA